jgi:hypothetical protein
MSEPFYFYTGLSLVELTGRKARNLVDLLEGIESLPGSSIYYHTHRFLKQHHFLILDPLNDFAHWITNVLQEDLLGERIASVDAMMYPSIRELRERFIEVIDEYLKANKELRTSPKDEEFHFMKCRTFVLPTKHSANDLAEFGEALNKISVDSLYFHIFESRLRLEKEANDFSYWLETSLGEKELADEIASLDPYTQALEGLRKTISLLVQKRLRNRTDVIWHT